MSRPIRVLDTGALLGYAHQTKMQVPSQLAYCADEGLWMRTSVLCVAEAYHDCHDDATDMLDVLLSLPTVEVVDCRVGDGDVVGNVAKRVERISLAHSCMLVWELDVPLMTTDQRRASKVLEDGLIWQI
ncbi:MAG TPA: hypothetical protein VF062_08160 [Candidatus Limnocylindrales bacterium]